MSLSNYTLQQPSSANETILPLQWHASLPLYQGEYTDNGWEVWTYDKLQYGLDQKYKSIEECNKEKGTNWYVDNNYVYKTIEGAGYYSEVVITPEQVNNALVLETTKEVEGFTISLSCPALYKLKSDKSGYAASHTVEVGIYYKKKTDPSYNHTWQCLTPKYTITSEPSRTEIVKSVSTHTVLENGEIRKLDLAVYKILVIRLTDSHTGDFDYADEIYVKEITEILYEELVYPHTAMLGIKIRATDQLSGSPPTVTSLVKGIKVSVPENLISFGEYNRSGYASPMGEMSTTKVWTDNPVWCLYDLLTNRRYGLADYYKINPYKIGLMRANFYLMAKYCDELVASSDTKDPAGTTAAGIAAAHVRPRFTLNMVIDQTKSATEWISAIAAIMRASVFYSEGIFWIDIDRPKLMTQIFNMSSIRDYTQTGTSYRGIPNSYDIQWINPEASHEVDVFRIESEEFRLNQSLEERKKALLLLGVTSFDQAKALGKYALYAGMYRTKIVNFKTHTAGLRSMVGDVVGIQHDVPQWGWGGKISEVGAIQAGTAEVTLSSSFDYPVVATELKMFVTQGTKTPFEVNLSEPTPGTDGVSTVILFTSYTNQDGTPGVYTPEVGDTYILSMVANPINKFKISAVKPDADGFCEITAVEYDEQLYDKCDDTSDLGTWVSTDHSLITNPQRTSCSGVVATSKIYTDSSGAFKTGIEIFFDPPKNSSFWRSAEIFYAPAGTGNYTFAGTTTSGYYMIPEINVEGAYQVVVCSTYSSGKQSVQDALNDTVNAPYTVVNVSLYVPNEYFMQGVTGLSVVNQANDGTFTGKDAIFKWNRPSSIDAAINTSADGTAGSISNDNWFKHYEITIREVSYASDDTTRSNPITGRVKRTTQVYDERFTYTSEMNHLDKPVSRNFQITVTAYDRLGRASAPKSLVAYNPAPPAIEDISLVGFIKSFQVNFSPSIETDTDGYLVFASKDSVALQADPRAFEVSDGTETSYQHFVSEGGTWYVLVAAYDTFGTDELNYSDVVSVQVSTLDPLDTVAPDAPIWETAVTGLEEGEI